MSGGAKALRAEGVRHSYGKGAGRCEVLKDFALELAEGEFAALMGPSGSGKSTFLHLAAGLLRPDAGRIEVGPMNIFTNHQIISLSAIGLNHVKIQIV